MRTIPVAAVREGSWHHQWCNVQALQRGRNSQICTFVDFFFFCRKSNSNVSSVAGKRGVTDQSVSQTTHKSGAAWLVVKSPSGVLSWRDGGAQRTNVPRHTYFDQDTCAVVGGTTEVPRALDAQLKSRLWQNDSNARRKCCSARQSLCMCICSSISWPFHIFYTACSYLLPGSKILYTHICS